MGGGEKMPASVCEEIGSEWHFLPSSPASDSCTTLVPSPPVLFCYVLNAQVSGQKALRQE